MPTIPRRRALDIICTTLLLSVLSTFSFATIYRDPVVFQPPIARTIFLLSTLVSWPPSLISAFLSIIAHRTVSDKFSRKKPGLRLFTWGAGLSILSIASLLVAQGTWIFVVARARVVWLLALVVLGLAMIVTIEASVIAVFSKALRIANDTGMEIIVDSGPTLPQKIIVKAPSRENAPGV